MKITGTCEILFVRVIGVVKVSLSIVLYTYCHQLFYNSFVTYTHGFPFWRKGCLNHPTPPLPLDISLPLKNQFKSLFCLLSFFFFSFINFFLFFFENSNTFVDEGKNTSDGKNFQFKHGYDTECTNLVDVNYFTLFGTNLKHFVCLTLQRRSVCLQNCRKGRQTCYIYLGPKDSNGNPSLSFTLDKNVKDRLITKSKSDIDLK